MALFLILPATLMATFMSIGWLTWRLTGKSGWIDTIWSLGVGATSLSILSLATESGPRAWLLMAMVLPWASRLGAHIAARTKASGDDPRYASLINAWGETAPRQLFLFLQYQAIAGWVLAVSVGLAAANAAPFPAPGDVVGLFIGVFALYGEALADRQLVIFRRTSKPGDVCDAGLWSLSRHPNYFFEWLFWLAIALVAFDLSGRWLWGAFALAAPLQMYWLLVHVSGVPPLEAHMSRSRGESYAAYQQRTPVFFPRLWRC